MGCGVGSGGERKRVLSLGVNSDPEQFFNCDLNHLT